MAWYLWLLVGIAVGAGGFLVLGVVLATIEERATDRRALIERQQRAAERQLDQLTLDTVLALFETARRSVPR